MKKILLTSFVLANLGLSAIACEADGVDHFMGNAWSGFSLNNYNVSDADQAFHAESDRRQMDFRYSNVKTTDTSEQKAEEKQEDKEG